MANAPAVLAKELSREVRRGRRGFIAISSSTEAWAPGIEDKYGVTRRCLGVILRYRFPIHCMTKSPLILRDLDLLHAIKEEAVIPRDLVRAVDGGVLVTFSFSTLREEIARVFEPGAPPIKDRKEALKKLVDEFMAGIAYMPILPFITDSEMNEMTKEAKDPGARYVFFAPLTLEGRGKELYLRVIERLFPELAEEYKELYRHRKSPSRPYTVNLYRRVWEVSRKYGLKLGITGNIL